MSIAIANVELYAKLRVQARALEKANKLQADFTAMIAHDLRSPLNTVLGVNELLTDSTFGPVTDEQKKWLGKATAIVRQLSSLVNDFLDVSKIEAGHIELSLAEVNLEDLIDSALDSFHAQAREKKIALDKRLDPAAPPIRGDRRRLEQVLTNLLSNALKFTPPGGAITIGAQITEGQGSRVSETGNPRFVELSVQDTGVGIPRAETGGLFEKYRQTTSGKTSEHKGTGLGLVICKMIVEAHGGRIWAESDEGEGARFVFTLPLTPPRQLSANGKTRALETEATI